MKVRNFKDGELSERGSADLHMEVTVDIRGFWTLEELNNLVDRMKQIDQNLSEEVEQLEGA